MTMQTIEKIKQKRVFSFFLLQDNPSSPLSMVMNVPDAAHAGPPDINESNKIMAAHELMRNNEGLLDCSSPLDVKYNATNLFVQVTK